MLGIEGLKQITDLQESYRNTQAISRFSAIASLVVLAAVGANSTVTASYEHQLKVREVIAEDCINVPKTSPYFNAMGCGAEPLEKARNNVASNEKFQASLGKYTLNGVGGGAVLLFGFVAGIAGSRQRKIRVNFPAMNYATNPSVHL